MLNGKEMSVAPSTVKGAALELVKLNCTEPSIRSTAVTLVGVPIRFPVLEAKTVSEA